MPITIRTLAQQLRVVVFALAAFVLVSCSQSGGSDDNAGGGEGGKVTAQAIEISLDEDTASNPIDVLQDIDDNSYNLASITQPGHGTATINTDGSITYQPAQDYAGDDSFTYTISNGNGDDLSADIVIHVTPVNDAPVAVAGGPYAVGTNSAFSPDGSQSYDVDGDALTYQWDFGDGTIANGLSPTKTYAMPGEYTVQLIVNDGTVDSTLSDAIVVVGAGEPYITQQPQSVAIQDGGLATFSVQAAGNTPLQYQWRQNSVNIPGAADTSYTTPLLTVPANVLSQTVIYDVVVSNAAGQVVSNTATLTVNANPPVVTTSPQSQNVLDQQQLILTVSAQGSADLHFQWRRNGVAINGAMSSSYVIPQVSYGQSDGSYDVVVSNAAGQAISDSALVTVQPRAVGISQPPIPRVINEGGSALFSVVVTGTPPITYQWQFNDADIPGATAAQFQIASATLSDDGNYRVVVTNPAGSVTTPAASLVVNKLPPQIITQPVPVSVNEGASASFSVVAQDDEPITYQWRNNGVDIPGATSATLVLNSVTLSDSGHYFSVVVSNSGASVVSNSVALSVVSAAAHVIMHPLSLAVYEGNSAMFSVAAGGTAPISYQWRRNGINIPGATNSFYIIQQAQFSDNGAYDVYVYNSAGADTSTDAELVVMPNAAPQAVRDTAMTHKNAAVTIDVLSNDTDTDGDTLTIQSATNGTKGTVSVISGSPDTVVYTPQANLYGKDTFTYVISDGKGKSATGQVVVNVVPWGTNQVIGSGEGPALASSTTHGDSFLSWRSGNNSASSIWGARYLEGSGWMMPQAPFGTGMLLNNLQVEASYFGAGYALWQDTNTLTGEQYLRFAEWNGLNWVFNSVVRPDPQVPIFKPRFTSSHNGQFPAVWLETDPVTGNHRVAWASYVWNNAALITDGSTDVDEPVMAVIDNNTPVFIWKDVASGNLLWRYGFSVIQPANDVLNVGGNNIQQPQIALNGSGKGVIAWLYDGTSYRLLKTRSISVSDSLTEPVLGSALSHPLGLNVLEARLAVAENGNIAVVWSQDDNGNMSLWIKRIIGAREVIEKLAAYTGVQPVNPDVTINSNGLITVVWEAQGKVLSRRFEANSVWSPVENLDDTYTGTSSHVVVDSIDNGQVTAAWQRDNGDIVTSIANINLGSVTPLPVNHTNAAFGSCNNAGCHSLPTGHITTIAECDSCHFNTLWKPTYNNISGYTAMRSCKSCHDNVIAQGKGATHIPTTTECNVCHTPESWLPVGGGVPDHSLFTGNCATCHDGVTASGKSTSHINTTTLCDACHEKFPANWAPVAAFAVDHAEVIGTCASCHYGKPVTHPNTTEVCDACHLAPPGYSWLPYIRPLDHTQVVGPCKSCHWKNAGHLATSDNCEACHNVPPATWVNIIRPLDHTQVIGICVSCHRKNAGHPTTTDICENCHGVPPRPWRNVTGSFSHADAFDECDACHSLPAGHCTPAGLCDDCHTITSWLSVFADCPTLSPPPPILPPPPPPPPPPAPGAPPPPPVGPGP